MSPPCGSGGGWGGNWGGGWGSGGWGSGSWGSSGWGGGRNPMCEPCPPCETGPGNCQADAPSCPRAPWLDCASIFGGMFRKELWEDNLPAGTTGRNLPLDAPLPSQNLGFTGDNIVIQCSGTYQITFFGNYKFSSNSLLTFYVKANGRTLEETVVEKTTTLNETDSFERTVIISLCANTTLRVQVDNAESGNGGFDGDLTIPAYGMHLSVMRIGAFRATSAS